MEPTIDPNIPTPPTPDQTAMHRPFIKEDPPFQLPLVLFVPLYLIFLALLGWLGTIVGHPGLMNFIGTTVMLVWVLFGGGAYQFEQSVLNVFHWSDDGVKIYCVVLWIVDFFWALVL